MIQLDYLRIEEFRGIREIELPLNSSSFVVHGPNGSGKSGVIDAIDFALTGRITRLAGAGTGGVSLLKHGPHVEKRNDPGSAVVALTVRDTASGETAVLKRNVKDAGRFSLEPDLPTVRASVLKAQSHPELTLSRREIVNYIVAKPGDRAQQVQALLRLERLDEYRKLLQSTVRQAKGDLKSAQAAVTTAEAKITSHFNIDARLPLGEVEREINKHRSTLGLMPLNEISMEMDLNAGMKNAEAKSSFNLASAKRETTELETTFADKETLNELQSKLIDAIDAVADDPVALEGIHHRQLVESGLNVLADNHCPLCDRAWDTKDDLKAHLDDKIRRSDEANRLQQALTDAATAYRTGITELKSAVDKVLPYAKPQSTERF